MSQWTADFTNDLFNNYEMIVEILHNGRDVAVIRRGESGLELKWYASDEDLTIPLDWITGLLVEAQNKLGVK